MKLTRSSLKELIRQSIYELEEGGKGSGRPKGGGALPVGKKKLKHPSGQDQYGKKAKIPNIRKVQITNAAPDVIRPDHISKTLKALEKAGSDKAKNFKKLGDMYIKHKNDLADKYNRVYNDGKGDEKKAEALWYKGMAKQEKIGKEMQKLMGLRESKMRRFTVKEVRTWMKTLEENRYKKVYNSDARRVSWMVNHLGENVANMPKSMRKKWTKAQYGRERYLAKEFLKSKKQQMAESKLRKTIRESIKKIMEAKIVRWDIPSKDKKKVEKLVKKLRLKDGKDYAIYGSGKTFEMELDSKHADKVLELLIKNKVNVKDI